MADAQPLGMGRRLQSNWMVHVSLHFFLRAALEANRGLEIVQRPPWLCLISFTLLCCTICVFHLMPAATKGKGKGKRRAADGDDMAPEESEYEDDADEENRRVRSRGRALPETCDTSCIRATGHECPTVRPTCEEKSLSRETAEESKLTLAVGSLTFRHRPHLPQ